MKILILFCLWICCIACNSNHTSSNTDLNEVDVTLADIQINRPNPSSLKPLRLSEFVDSITYLQLETTLECLLSTIATNYYKLHDFLLVVQGNKILEFDHTTGKFLRQVGRVGQGPGEYLQVNEAVDKENGIIYVKSPGNPKLLKYDYQGNFLGDLILTDTEDFLFSSSFSSLNLMDIDDQCMTFYADFMPRQRAVLPYELIVYDYKKRKYVILYLIGWRERLRIVFSEGMD